MLSLFRVVLVLLSVVVVKSLPFLNMADFSWAENLLITHSGLYMFVSDNTRGELYRITLNDDGTEYVRTAHVSGDEISAFGGLAQSADGSLIYAGVTFSDKTTAIITTAADSTNGDYEILYSTKYQPNGLQIDLRHDILYYTDTSSGSLMAVNIENRNAITEDFVESLMTANGCWLDSDNSLMYVGQLTSKQVNVFNTSSGMAELVDKYSGLNSLSKGHMLDDLTLYSTSDKINYGNTVMLGADYQGKAVQQFTLSGEQISEVEVSEQVLSNGSLQEITSVRWGVKPNFDEGSVYVSEGGGMRAQDKSRRVFQIVM